MRTVKGSSGPNLNAPPFARWLKTQIDRTGIEPTALAARAGVSSAFISMLRNGRRQPSYEVLVALVDALDIPNRLDEALAAADLPPQRRESRRKNPATGDTTSRGRRGQRRFAPPDDRRPDDTVPALIQRYLEELRSDNWKLRLEGAAMLAKCLEVVRQATDAMTHAYAVEQDSTVRRVLKGALDGDHEPAALSSGQRAAPGEIEPVRAAHPRKR